MATAVIVGTLAGFGNTKIASASLRCELAHRCIGQAAREQRVLELDVELRWRRRGREEAGVGVH